MPTRGKLSAPPSASARVPFSSRRVEVIGLLTLSPPSFPPSLLVRQVVKVDKENWTIEARAKGSLFSRETHECGTEVKAITYSAMQIYERNNEAEIFVIVDI